MTQEILNPMKDFIKGVQQGVGIQTHGNKLARREVRKALNTKRPDQSLIF